MQTEAFLWMFLPVFVAAGSALLSFYIMQARMEVAISKERETLAEARATINSQKITMDERIKATEEATKRIAMDEFMQDIRIEERSYVRENKSLNSSKRSMVMQERLFFRNIPLSNWIEHEMVVEEGNNLDQLPAPESVFATPALNGDTRPVVSKFLDENNNGRLPVTKFLDNNGRNRPEPGVSIIPTRIAAFGAQ